MLCLTPWDGYHLLDVSGTYFDRITRFVLRNCNIKNLHVEGQAKELLLLKTKSLGKFSVSTILLFLLLQTIKNQESRSQTGINCL